MRSTLKANDFTPSAPKKPERLQIQLMHKDGRNRADDIARGIAMELQLIREELQKLTSTVKSIASRPQQFDKT
jgi:hypothetical protein